jgi:hypothetical protein
MENVAGASRPSQPEKLSCLSNNLHHCELGKWHAIFTDVPGWRNGRRYGLKIRCPKGRAGSTPALGTTLFTTLCITFRIIFLYVGWPDEGKMRGYLNLPMVRSAVGFEESIRLCYKVRH